MNTIKREGNLALIYLSEVVEKLESSKKGGKEVEAGVSKQKTTADQSLCVRASNTIHALTLFRGGSGQA